MPEGNMNNWLNIENVLNYSKYIFKQDGGYRGINYIII